MWEKNLCTFFSTEQKKEEGGKFHPLQRFSSDLAAEGEPGYKHFMININFYHDKIIFCLSFCVVSHSCLLGGNSRTAMVAALSPADINYDETLSTLR